MDTVYYHLNVRRTKVSGGADLLSVVPVSAPAPGGKSAEILDFDRCRRHLETKAAWQELAQAAEAPLEEAQAPVREAAPSRRERRLVWLDVCASASVIAVSLAAVAAFFHLS